MISDFYLAWPHRRHRSTSHKLPGLSNISSACVNFENRIHWQWYFRSVESAKSYLRLKHWFTTPTCNEILPPELKSWTYLLHDGVLKVASQILRSKSSRKNWSSFGHLERLARNWILDNRVILYGDKRGHVCLVRHADLVSCHNRWLTPPILHIYDS